MNFSNSVQQQEHDIAVFESNVRSYCRNHDCVFTQAQGSLVHDEDGNQYIDFFAGAGTLNYGHNEPVIKQQVVEYLMSDGIVHSLDLFTQAKRHFVNTFDRHILKPRGLNYKMQFTGPTGTTAIETSIKLARKYTGRQSILSFTGGFHGMSMGSLGLTASQHYRQAFTAGNIARMPFDGYFGAEIDTLDIIEQLLTDPGSGIELPAAIVLETIQGEGGINVASRSWLQRLSRLAEDLGVLLIADDIQVGCGRTGDFFSFEDAGITPDIVCLSKSLSSLGLPMAMVLMRPELDIWQPGEDIGTFRGNNLAFVAAATAIKTYWADDAFSTEIKSKGNGIFAQLEQLKRDFPELIKEVRGRGFIFGIEFNNPNKAKQVMLGCFKDKLIVETAGARGQVVKLIPPLNTSEDLLSLGMSILAKTIDEVSRMADDESEVMERIAQGEEVAVA